MRRFLVFFEGKIRTAEIDREAKQIRYVEDRCECKRQKAKKLGIQLSKKEGIPFYQSPNKIPGYKAIKKARREQKQRDRQRARQAILENGKQDFEAYALQYANDQIALAHLVRHLNRYAKCYSSFRERTTGNEAAIRLIYLIKDKWLRLNRKNIIKSSLAIEKTQTYTDWDSFRRDRALYGEVHVDDYARTSTYRLYAYELSINGEIFKFHSQEKLVDDIEYDPGTNGSAQPLSSQEREALPIRKALLMAISCLGGDLSGINKATEPEDPIRKSADFDDYW